MFGAVIWGAVAASSLLCGALLSMVRTWSDRSIGIVLGFGVGALIASVSFELAEDGFHGGGVLLDGIPEQTVLGPGLGAGESVSIALLVAVFVSNLPESARSSAEMLQAGRPRSFVLGLWSVVTVVCIAATWAGAAVSTAVSTELTAGIKGFAVGALLVMLVDSTTPAASPATDDAASVPSDSAPAPEASIGPDEDITAMEVDVVGQTFTVDLMEVPQSSVTGIPERCSRGAGDTVLAVE